MRMERDVGNCIVGKGSVEEEEEFMSYSRSSKELGSSGVMKSEVQ